MKRSELETILVNTNIIVVRGLPSSFNKEKFRKLTKDSKPKRMISAASVFFLNRRRIMSDQV